MDEGRRFVRVDARTYRIFVFDPSQFLRRTDLIECADDQDAIAHAIELAAKCLRGWSVEVWHLARRVITSQAQSIITLLAADLSDGKLDLFGLLSS